MSYQGPMSSSVKSQDLRVLIHQSVNSSLKSIYLCTNRLEHLLVSTSLDYKSLEQLNLGSIRLCAHCETGNRGGGKGMTISVDVFFPILVCVVVFFQDFLESHDERWNGIFLIFFGGDASNFASIRINLRLKLFD